MSLAHQSEHDKMGDIDHEEVAKKVFDSIKDKRNKYINTRQIEEHAGIDIEPFSNDDELIKLHFHKLSSPRTKIEHFSEAYKKKMVDPKNLNKVFGESKDEEAGS